ncbi:acyltransferase [Hydrogenophaga sp. 5NK40-0174]|uniref:acyltransferase family protein n=1 Tax=Hydrogenophaga sp. 5NK40-0174 TaxID=3127649 RepID=UPI00310A6FBB
MNFVPVLHGLRGLAALAVLLFHWEATYPALSKAMADISLPLIGQVDLFLPLRYGWLGVSWFFVLSGYLLAATLWEKPLAPRLLAGFWWRRALRIYPAVWVQVIILLAVVLGFGIMKDFQLSNAIGNAMLWLSPLPGGARIYNGVYWTLPIELSFYLFLPVMLWWYRRTSIWVFVLSCLAITVGWRAGLAGLHLMQSPHAISLLFIRGVLPGMLFLFACGMALNHWQPPQTEASRNQWLVIAMVSGVVLTAIHYQLRAFQIQDHLYMLMFEVALAVPIALMTACMLKPSRLTAWVSAAPLVWLGEISFGLYLWHFPIQRMLPRLITHEWDTPMGSLQALAISLVGSLVLASISYYWLERPVLTRLSGRRLKAGR